MSRLNPNLRNAVIVLAIAALVAIVPGGGTAARVAIQAVALLFLAAMAWIATRLYREHRVALYGLGDGRRAVLYLAVGAAVVVLSATSLMLSTGVGTIVWVVVLGACAYAIFAVVWAARQY
jgi:hypothetical protein